MKVRRAFQVIVNLVMRLSLPHSLSFPNKMRLAGILPHSLGPVLRSEVIVNLHVMRPAAPCVLKFFQGKRASQEGFLWEATAIANFHLYPTKAKSWQRNILQAMLGYRSLSSSRTAGRSCEKGYRPWDSQFFETHVTPKGWDVKGGIPQDACWRLGCGEACKRWNTIGPSQKPQPFKGAREKCNEIALSMCTAQCGSMEAKAWSFVLRAARSERYKSSTSRVFTYVVGGRVGMNDTCYFTLDVKKLDSTLLYSTLLYSTLLYSTPTLLYSTLLYSTPTLLLLYSYSTPTLLYSTLLYSTLLYLTLLYLTLLYSTLTLLFSTLLYFTILYSTLLYSTLLYSYSTLLYSTLLYYSSTLLYFTQLCDVVRISEVSQLNFLWLYI